jgi:hypothetical protein
MGAPLPATRSLYEALLPYAGKLVVWGGANMITGPVDDYLGRLAAHLGRPADAAAHFDQAVALEERLGALPWLAATLTARGRPGDRSRAQDIAAGLGLSPQSGAEADRWALTRDGVDWVLEAGGETVRLRDLRGVHYLRTLVGAPGQEIAALDLVAGGAGLRVRPADPILDATARDDFRRRLAQLDALLDTADRTGDTSRAREVTHERAALLAELSRALGRGGRRRRPSAEAERARVNATRALAAVVKRLEPTAPLAAAHLRASLRTGSTFRYQPMPGGPARWQL